MLKHTCAACGGVLQKAEHNTAVCMKCFRTYNITSYQIQNPNPAFQREQDEEWRNQIRIGLIILLSVATLFCAGVGLFPISIVLSVQIVKQLKSIAQSADRCALSYSVKDVPCGEYLKNPSDYTRALRGLPIGTMPLGLYAERAALQIEQLVRKQKGLSEMLGKEHPFLNSAHEAEAYILANCKKVLWRLKYCDQSDPQLCRLHAEYLQGVLDENDRILRDYEQLLIEVTQMDDDLPRTAPHLDVLATALHSVRTGEQMTGVQTPQ